MISLANNSEGFVNWQSIGEGAREGAEFLQDLTQLIDVTGIALKSLQLIRKMSLSANLIISLVSIFVDIPDPSIEKMNQIQGAISSLQDQMMNEF